MLQIRLSTVPPSEGGGGGAAAAGGGSGGGGGGPKPSQMESVTVACPDHLVLADLPVAKSLGSVTAAASIVVRTLGRRSRRQPGERVHVCVRCDYPIAIYGRLSPCEHAFCLDCARSDSLCYLCDERIQKIQTIKLMEGIFVCAAPHCLKSFLKKSEFESHVYSTHSDLLGRHTKKDNTDVEAVSARKPAASDSTVQAPLRQALSPSSNSQIHDRDDKRVQSRDQQPTRLVIQPKSTLAPYGQGDQQQPRPQGYDGPSPRFPQQGFETQPPNYPMPVNSNFPMVPGQFGYPPFAPNGQQPFYGAPFEMMRPDSTTEGGSEQGSLLGFPPIYPQGPWNMPPGGMPVGSAPTGVQTDSQGVVMFQGDYGRNQGGVLPSPNSGGNVMDTKGILAPPPQPFQPPPPHLGNVKRGNFYPADMANDGQQQSFGWQHEKRDSFGNGQD